MSFYQAQNPSFFTSLHPAASLTATIATLKQRFMQPTAIIVDNATGTYSLSGEGAVVYSYLHFKGGSAVNLMLPSGPEVRAALEAIFATTLNVNGTTYPIPLIMTSPSIALSTYAQAKRMFNWKIVVYNQNSSNITITVPPGNTVALNDTTNQIAPNNVAILNCLVTSIGSDGSMNYQVSVLNA